MTLADGHEAGSGRARRGGLTTNRNHYPVNKKQLKKAWTLRNILRFQMFKEESRTENSNYPESKGKQTAYQNLWDTVKLVLRGHLFFFFFFW